MNFPSALARQFPSTPTLFALAFDVEKLNAMLGDLGRLTGRRDDGERLSQIGGTLAITATADARGLVFDIVHEERR